MYHKWALQEKGAAGKKMMRNMAALVKGRTSGSIQIIEKVSPLLTTPS